jgi:antitoxin component of MazEF toxin-antitoxin module
MLLPQALLELLGWEVGTEVELKVVNGRDLLLSPVAEEASPPADKKPRRKKLPES